MLKEWREENIGKVDGILNLVLDTNSSAEIIIGIGIIFIDAALI